jgi:hypothetical protein
VSEDLLGGPNGEHTNGDHANGARADRDHANGDHTVEAAPQRLAVALLGGARVASALSERTGCTVVGTTEEDHLAVAADLGGPDTLVVGLAAVPWPAVVEIHAEGSAGLPAYTGVVSWHALPLLHDRLAEAVAPAAARGVHVLLTAPDPGPDTDPGDVAFLTEVAEAVAARAELRSRSVAWRGTTRTPTAVDALTSLVEAHGKRDVVELPIAPGTTADPALQAAADGLGARLTCIDLGQATLLELLTAVVVTVAEHEGIA